MTYDPSSTRPVTATAERVVDAGLQAHMRAVYNNMTWGLAVTGATAFGIAHFEPLYNLVVASPLHLVFAFAPLAFLWFGLSSAKLLRMDAAKARTMFVVFCVLMGASMATIFAVYTGASVARVFFITAATFATMSLFGYTTKKDLSGMGHFMMMGLMGIVIAMLVNIFVGSPLIDFVVSGLGVVIFTCLTAWETQNIKETYAVAHGRETNDKLAVIGALSLYLCFINLFQFLMNFMGQRE